MSWRGNRDERGAMTTGCVLALGSALFTCLMLAVNGSLVMAILTAVTEVAPPWASKPELSQFLLFTLPVLFVVAQWMMIDYVRTKLWQR